MHDDDDDHRGCVRARCGACATAVSRDGSPPKKGRKKDVRFSDDKRSRSGPTDDGGKGVDLSPRFKLNLKRLPFVVAQVRLDV